MGLARLFPSDEVINDNAYFYRYSIKRDKIDKFPGTRIIHREYLQYNEYLAHIPGNSEGVTISKEQNTVSHRNGLYFYVWSDTEISDRELNALFLKAARKYFGGKIHDLEMKADAYKLRLKSVEEFLK